MYSYFYVYNTKERLLYWSLRVLLIDSLWKKKGYKIVVIKTCLGNDLKIISNIMYYQALPLSAICFKFKHAFIETIL